MPLAPLYEASPVGVIIADQQGRILTANPALRSLLGRSEQELVGRDVGTLLHEDDLWPGVEGAHVRLADGAGGHLWVYVSEAEAAVESGREPARLILVRDESEERRLARELEIARHRFRQITENVHDGFLLLSPDLRRVVQASSGVRALLAEDGDPAAPPSLDSIHPKDRRKLAGEAERIRAEKVDLQMRLVNSDGTIRAWIQVRTFPLRDPGGEVSQVVGIVEDVTGRKKVAEMLAQARQHAARLVQTVQDPQGIIRGATSGSLQALGPGPLGASEANAEERRAYAERSAALTPREREVMELLVAGGTTKAIAAELTLSPKTVEVYRARVMKKMEATSVAALVRLVLLGSAPLDS